MTIGSTSFVSILVIVIRRCVKLLCRGDTTGAHPSTCAGNSSATSSSTWLRTTASHASCQQAIRQRANAANRRRGGAHAGQRGGRRRGAPLRHPVRYALALTSHAGCSPRPLVPRFRRRSSTDPTLVHASPTRAERRRAARRTSCEWLTRRGAWRAVDGEGPRAKPEADGEAANGHDQACRHAGTGQRDEREWVARRREDW